jgi:hypothetical protein
MYRHTTVIAMCSLLAVGCAGSTGNANTSQPVPETGKVPVITTAEQIWLPLDEFTLTAEENQLVSRAFQRLVSRCADRFGVTVTIPPPQNPTSLEMNARRYGIVEDTYVDRLGYALEGMDEQDDGTEKGGWDPGPREDMVLRGVVPDGTTPPVDARGQSLPAGGCIGEAERALGGLPPADPAGPSMESFGAAEQDPRVQEAFADWSTCMAAAGYTYKTPWEANDANWPDPTGAKEIGTARQDLTCRRQTNLVGTWLAVETAYQERTIRQHADLFQRLKTWRDNRVQKARNAVDS